jgi:hypothetical protein
MHTAEIYLWQATLVMHIGTLPFTFALASAITKNVKNHKILECMVTSKLFL